MTAQEIQIYRDSNMIGISVNELDRPIYRIFNKDHLIDNIRNATNTLVKPRLWEDPFENFLLRSTPKNASGNKVYLTNLAESMYGQCWTFNSKETDALWRIYSKDINGLRVKTTIRKLFYPFYEQYGNEAIISCFIGKVEYWKVLQIKKYFENPQNAPTCILDNTGKGQAKTLLIKRPEFKHEREIRIILNADKSHVNIKQNIYQYHIDDINNFYEEILADPRMLDIELKDITTELRSLGYHKSIKQSKLYQIPNFQIALNY
jgi:hypothetical protein